MKALLVDDHPLILWAMQAVIRRLGKQVEVHGVETAAEARAMLQRHGDFDIMLLDLHLGDANGFDLLRELRQTYPALPVVVVSASDRPADVKRAIECGAMGFVPKRASNEMLYEALHLVLSGGVYVPPMITGAGEPPPDAGELSKESRSAVVGLSNEAAEPAPMTGRALPGEGLEGVLTVPESLPLTVRQREVLALVLQGKQNKAIARELALSVETVKDHVAAVLRCLGVNSRTQAVLVINQMLQRQQLGAAPIE